MSNFELTAQRVIETTDPTQRLQVVTEIRDSIEIVHTPEYKNFLHHLFPVFYNLLRQGPPQFTDGTEQKIRNVLLEILNRLPNNEMLRPYVQNLLKLSMYLLEVENEENAVICLRIIIDLHKNYRPSLETEVQPFLDIVQKIYTELPKTVVQTFKEGGMHPPMPMMAGSGVGTGIGSVGAFGGGPEAPKAALTRSMQSFKVLTECPIIVVLLFQLYPRFLTANIPKFMPLIVNTLTLQAPPSARAQHHPAYVDFIASQVKTLSFLAYMLRGFADHLRPYQENIPKCVIQLLLNCPNESTATRKELLIATRHILATDFRIGFISHIDTLLDEKVLIGTGRTSQETLRPLAHSTLADLVHHVRQELSLPQLSRVVYLYARNIHDSSLAFSIQTMSAKLVMNLIECIARKNDPNDGKGRALMVRILDAFVNKFRSLKKQIPKLIGKQAKSHKPTDLVKDCRWLMKNLVFGLKNTAWGISSCTPNIRSTQGNAPMPGASQPGVINVTGGASKTPIVPPSVSEESLIFTRLLKNGLKCFTIYSSGPNPSTQEEKDILDHFAAVFTLVDPRIFQEVMSSQIPFLFDRMVENQAMLTIPQHFLANPGVSRIFADILLNFLIERMKSLAGNDKIVSSVLLRLFKLVFGSVTLFAENEPVLQPHLATIITSAMKHAYEVKDSINYFVLLRALFRSIGGGKFDLFFKEFLPLLPSLLEGLNRLQLSSHNATMKELFVELALTVPVRLSALLPCLKLLMRPLVLALESNTELAIQGMRTLELCVDSLAPDFLDPILANVKPELMLALWKHLKPGVSAHSSQVLRILGKLAGRSRQFLQTPYKLKPEEHSFNHVTFNVTIPFEQQFQPNQSTIVPIPVSLTKAIVIAKQKLVSAGSDLECKKQSFLFLKACLDTLLKTKSTSEKGDYMEVFENSSINYTLQNTIRKRNSSISHIVKMLLDSMIITASNDKLTGQDSTSISTSTSNYNINGTTNTTGSANLNQPTNSIATVVKSSFEELIHYFASLFVSSIPPPAPLPISSIVSTFLDSLIDGLTAENRSYAKTVLRAVDLILQSCTSLKGSLESACELPEFSDFARRLCHCCYRAEWHYKSGGCLGISHLAAKMSPNWLRKHQLQFIKALLFIIKDLAPELSIGTVEEATEALTSIIKICDAKTDSNSVDKATITDVVSLLSQELYSANTTVRSTVQSSLQLLSTLNGIGLTELLEPVKASLISSIFAKPLRSLPVVVQTGYLDALAFCLSLRPPLLSFSNELVRMLQGALTIAEKDEVTTNKTINQKTMQLFTNLRTVSLELLSAAINCQEFQDNNEHAEFRNKIIGVFFKALTLRSKEIVNVAKKGLAQVTSQQKLQKELLQSSLRPILLNLADYRKLSVPLLNGLARLLELLTNCFNVTLGEKLLEHLNKWTEPTTKWKDGEEIKIAASIIEIFHLLPSAASKFLEPLVLITLQLESQLTTRETSSPFRSALIKFLNRYPTESVDYFLARITQTPLSKLFRYIIKDEIAGPLREELSKNVPKLISSTFHFNSNFEAQFQGILIVRALIKFNSMWLSQNRTVLDCLVEMWQLPGRLTRLTSSDESMPLHYVNESRLLIKCFLNYCTYHREEVDVLFYMLSIFTVRTTSDFSFLKEFYATEVAEKYSQEEKRAILYKFLLFFKDSLFSQEHKVQVLQVLINPMLIPTFLNDQYKEAVDSKIIASIVGEILDHKGEIYDEALNIELLQLATLLLRFMSPEMLEHRKELIKFAWNHLKSEDMTTRQCAYVLVCRFIEAYDTPPKIILQVYVALLRAFQPEARSLVKQALDILTPALGKRLPAGNDPKFPTWIKWTKKIVVEEGHSLPQMIHILQLIVRHPNLFYQCRGQFVPLMVNSLARIGLLPNSPHENRKLAVDLAELVINWEKQRIDEASAPKDHDTHPMELDATSQQKSEDHGPSSTSMDVEDPTRPSTSTSSKPPTATHTDASEFKANSAIAEMIVNFLIRIASTGTDAADHSSSMLPTHSLELLKEALTLWSEATIKFAYFDKLLTATDSPTIVCTGLGILNVILDYQLHRFVTENISSLQNSLTPSITCNQPKIITALCILLEKIMKYFPLTLPAVTLPSSQLPAQDISSFYAHVSEIIEASLHNFEKSNVHSILLILNTLSDNNSLYIDRFVPALVKIIQKYTKDHIAPASRENVSNTDAGTDHLIRLSMSNQNKKLVKDTGATLSLAINLVSSRASVIGDNKKVFFASLLTLLEKSPDPDLLADLTKIIGGWITGKISTQNGSTVALTSAQIPSMNSKEKITFLVKMIRFDQMSTATNLQASFLDIILHIFEDSNSSKAEHNQLNNGFMMGLRHKEPTIRNNFFAILHRNAPKTLQSRLEYIFSSLSWEAMGNSFWIKQALELILALSVQNYPIQISLPEIGDQKSEKQLPHINSVQVPGTLIEFKDLLQPLRELIYSDVELSYHLWVQVFSIIWDKCLTQEDRDKLSTSMTTFLSKEYHSKQQRSQPNVIQPLLEGIAACKDHNPPNIPVEIIKHLGKNFNCWHISIKILEDKLMHSNSTEMMILDGPSSPLSTDLIPCDLALAELYQLLSEEDLFYCVWKKRAVSEDTRGAVTLEQFGLWNRAQEILFNIMNKSQSGAPKGVPSTETCFWEDQWIQCAKRLNQWEILTEYGKSQQMTELLLESAWKIGDWTTMKETLAKTSPNYTADTPQLRLYQSYTALYEAKVHDVEALSNQLVQLAIKQHQSLPEIPAVAHIPVLHLFQEIVELKESSQIIKDINGANKHQSIPDVKSTLGTWRERLPNSWDDIVMWNELLTWRQHVFTLINAAFASAEVSNAAYIGHHEMAWTINTFAHVARKHELLEVCLNALSKIYTLPNIEIQEAFVKLQEQVKCYFQLPNQYRTGLDIINSTNLDYFGPQQKAEFFQLKAEFLARMGNNEEAHTAFSTSLSIYDGLAKGWISWGLFCDHQYTESNDTVWAEYSINCYLQAIKCQSNRARRQVLARVFWFLTFDDENEKLIKAFEKNNEPLPLWIFIHWIPQMLSSLSRPEAVVMKNILLKIATMYPQSLFYSLRAFLLEKREHQQLSTVSAFPIPLAMETTPPTPALTSNPNPATPSHPSGSAPMEIDSSTPAPVPVSVPIPIPGPVSSAIPAGPSVQPVAVSISAPSAPPVPPTPTATLATSTSTLSAKTRQPALKHAEEVMGCLKATHGAMAADMEAIVKEISMNLQAEPEEILLHILDTILLQCYEYPTILSATVPEKIKEILQAVSKFTFFAVPQTLQAAKKYADFLHEFRQPFEKELAHEINLTSLTEKLKSWILKLKAKEINSEKIPAKKLNLEEISPYLVEFQSTQIEIPGQYHQDLEPSSDLHVRIERINNEVLVVSSPNALGERCLQIRGHNGKLYNYRVQTLIPNGILNNRNTRQQDHKAEERISQFLHLISLFLGKHKETRKRNVYLHIPSAVTFSSRMRLIECETDYMSLHHLLEQFNQSNHSLPYAQLDLYKQLLLNVRDSPAAKLKIFHQISEQVPENILSKYIQILYPSPSQMVTFKKQFTTQLSTSAFIAHVLGIKNRTPRNLAFSKSIGSLTHLDFYPEYSKSSGLIDSKESVPMRLTRNLQHFMNGWYIDGIVNGVMTGTAMCLNHYKEQLKFQLALYLRDDMIAWHNPEEYDSDNKKAEIEWKKKVKSAVDSNVNIILSNIKNFAPPSDKGVPINQSITQLLVASQNAESISQMDPTWHPWF